MQIIIDIPKYVYDTCMDCNMIAYADLDTVEKAIKNGVRFSAPGESLLDILGEIHMAEMEKEVFEELSKWMIAERDRLLLETSRHRSTLVAIEKIAHNNPNRKEALEGIKSLCEEERWKKI